MSEPRIFQLDTGGRQLPVTVGDRVSLPTNAEGTGVDVVPDPEGTHIVISYESGLLEAQKIVET
jgi:hypothetical protein